MYPSARAPALEYLNFKLIYTDTNTNQQGVHLGFHCTPLEDHDELIGGSKATFLMLIWLSLILINKEQCSWITIYVPPKLLLKMAHFILCEHYKGEVLSYDSSFDVSAGCNGIIMAAFSSAYNATWILEAFVLKCCRNVMQISHFDLTCPLLYFLVWENQFSTRRSIHWRLWWQLKNIHEIAGIT